MFRTAIDKLQRMFKGIREAARQRRQRKLAELAEMEMTERKALVSELSKKFDEAHADCEQNDKALTTIELSLKEIIFIEWNLKTWSRHFKESEIYQPSPQR
jgi:hypothetical protein